MLNRVCALWLVALATVPFTAPFATLDLSDFLGHGSASTLVETIAALPLDAQADTADDAASSVAFVQRSQAAVLSALAPVVSPLAGDAVLSIAATLSPLESAPPLAQDVFAHVDTLRL